MNEELDLTMGAERGRPPALLRAWSAVVGWAGTISPEETSVRRRGFVVDEAAVVQRLEDIGRHFVSGYNQAIGSCDLGELSSVLAASERANAGFVYEGAAMGVAVADFMTPGRRMFDRYVAGPAAAHEYMSWVGLGWALARLPVPPERALARYDDLHCWLALDGYGFHEGYFHWPGRIDGQRKARGLSADGQRVFDQGLGRSMWFVKGAAPQRVATCIAMFPAERHADLWAGVGLAAAYAGAVPPASYGATLAMSGRHAGSLAQGVVFAAQARRRAGNPVAHTEQACLSILGLDAASAAAIATDLMPADGHCLASYQRWRFAIVSRCSEVAPRVARQCQGGS